MSKLKELKLKKGIGITTGPKLLSRFGGNKPGVNSKNTVGFDPARFKTQHKG